MINGKLINVRYGKSVNQKRAREVLITYCVCDHLFQTDIKHDVTVPEKKYGIQPTDK